MRNRSSVVYRLLPVLPRCGPLLWGLLLWGLPLWGPTWAGAQQPSAEVASAFEREVRFLASEELGGRLTGSEGERRAAEYLVERLEDLGATPLPGSDSFLQTFEYTSGSSDAGTSLSMGEVRWTGTDTVQALSFSDSGEVTGELVFAGYGLRVPDSDDFGYDSYATLDVADKIVVVLRYFPEDTEGDVRATLARYSGLRYKALLAREEGAKGMILVTGPRSPNAGEVAGMSFDTASSGSGILAASISGEVALALFEGADQSLEEAQAALDGANPHATGFPLEKTVTLDVRVERERGTGTNVVGMLPAGPREAESVEKPWVVVGAHYDHLGRGGGGNSLADADQRDAIHVGADDNASGTAAVLELGRRLADEERRRERRRSIVLALWSGEELGLLGSAAFAQRHSAGGDQEARQALKLEDVAAYVNFDMVGRSRNNELSAQATGTSEAWPRLLERSNVPVGFDLKLQADPYLPTDSASFHRHEIPTLNFFTGAHVDYHKPSDVVERVNFEDLERVAKLGTLVVRRLSEAEEPPSFQQVQRTRRSTGSRDTVRAYTGTIPDYATEVEGLLLGGVMAGGPAEEAGLQEGDIIVRFGDIEITNIYDYTYALDGVKVDEPVKVVYLRDGERRETTIIPRARD